MSNYRPNEPFVVPLWLLIPQTKLIKGINKKVYPHIYVTDVEIVDETFHSRINAKKKEYRYYVSLNTFDPLKANYMHFFHDRIDIAKIREAMKYIEGTHDFKSFSKDYLIYITDFVRHQCKDSI